MIDDRAGDDLTAVEHRLDALEREVPPGSAAPRAGVLAVGWAGWAASVVSLAAPWASLDTPDVVVGIRVVDGWTAAGLLAVAVALAWAPVVRHEQGGVGRAAPAMLAGGGALAVVIVSVAALQRTTWPGDGDGVVGAGAWLAMFGVALATAALVALARPDET